MEFSFSSTNFSNNRLLMRGLVPFHKMKSSFSCSSIIFLIFLSLTPKYSAVSCTDKVYLFHQGICKISLWVSSISIETSPHAKYFFSLKDISKAPQTAPLQCRKCRFLIFSFPYSYHQICIQSSYGRTQPHSGCPCTAVAATVFI